MGSKPTHQCSNLDVDSPTVFTGTSEMFNKIQFGKHNKALYFNPIHGYEKKPNKHGNFDREKNIAKNSFDGSRIRPNITTLIISDARHLDYIYDLPTTINTIYFTGSWIKFNVSRYLHMENYHFVYGCNGTPCDVVFDNADDYNSYIENLERKPEICGKLPYGTLISFHIRKYPKSSE